MNSYMVTQINQILLSVRVFEDSMRIAARKDDGEISREEERILRRIRKASARYTRRLEQIRGPERK